MADYKWLKKLFGADPEDKSPMLYSDMLGTGESSSGKELVPQKEESKLDITNPVSYKNLMLRRELGDTAPYESKDQETYKLDVPNSNPSQLEKAKETQYKLENPIEAYGDLAPTVVNTKEPLLNLVRKVAGSEVDPKINSKKMISQETPIPETSTQPQTVPISRKLQSEKLPVTLLPSSQSSPFKPYSSEDELLNAQNLSNESNLAGNLGKAGQMINEALTGKKYGTEIYDSILKNANLPIEQYKERQEGKLKDIKLGSQKDLQDPSSSLSKTSRDLLGSLGLKVPDNTSALQLHEMGVNIGSLLSMREQIAGRKETAKIYGGFREDAQKDKRNQENIKNLTRLQGDFNKDKSVQSIEAGRKAAEDAEALLELDNPITSEAVKTSLARLSGEVGVLTDRDVARFGGSKAVKDRFSQSIKQMIDGKITEENKKFMREIINTYKTKREKQLDNRALYFAKQGAKRLGVSEEEAFENLLPGRNIPKGEEVITSQEERRFIPREGKWAIFDKESKQFKRWTE